MTRNSLLGRDGLRHGVCCDYMLEVAHMGLHVAQMTSQKGIRQCFDAVTVNAAKVMHLEGYGIAPGCDASFVLLQARDAVEAIRLKVWKKGTLLAAAAEAVASLHLPQRPSTTHFMPSSQNQISPLSS